MAYLSGIVQDKGDIPIYIDLRKIGSAGGLYSDSSVPLAERATRLLMDTLSATHDELLEVVLDDSFGLNLAKVGPALDELADAETGLPPVGINDLARPHYEIINNKVDIIQAHAKLVNLL